MIQNIWENHGFELILGFCVVFILLLALYNFFSGKKGTFSHDKVTMQNARRQENQRNGLQGSSLQRSGLQRSSPPQYHSPPPKFSKGETECRRVLEQMFQKPFTSQRPDFLRNPVTGGNFNLELDCFNQELGLAVEYNGIQHYKYIPHFHRNHEHFMNQKYRDDMKRRLCKENRVTLIEVPYTIKIPDIYSFIDKACKSRGY